MVRGLITRVPVRVALGLGDPYNPARVADAIPGPELEIVEKGGHSIPISEPQRVATAVRAVLAATPPAELR